MKNKITYLISFEYFPISQAGLARHAKAVIDGLLKYDGFQAVIAVPNNKAVKINKKIITIPCIFFKNKYLCYFEFSLRFFFRFKHQFYKESFVFFSLVSYFLLPFLPRRFYIFVHSNEKRIFCTNYPDENFVERIIRKFLYFFNFQWEKYLCKKAKRVFSVSSSLKTETVYQYRIDKNKITVINNGLDANIFKKTLKVKKNTKNLLFVGKIIYRKNIIDLIKIFKLLTNIDPEFKLHIMGNGPQKYLCIIKEKINNLELKDKVFLYNYSSDTGLNKLYEKCSLFVSTSLIEGFGLVLLEAMNKGLPIIAYENLGFNDVIVNQKNGYLVKKNDHGDFVNKILHVSKNKKIFQQMSKKALKRADSFSWDTSIQKLIKELL